MDKLWIYIEEPEEGGLVFLERISWDTKFLILERIKTSPPWMFEYCYAGNDSNASF